MRHRGLASLLAVLALAGSAWVQRTELKPGWNLFSPSQDVEMGKEVAADAEKKLPMLNDRKVDEYLTRLGLSLAAKAPGAKYPYQFKAVNDMSINAFALPGGFLYIHRGTIEAADDEAQLAGVVAHEIGHVALRHGTNQASKAYLAQMPLAIFGGLMGSQSVGAVLAQIGAGFAADSVLLKYSRDAERQADLMGTQILYDDRYDPRAMVQFFEKLKGEGASRAPQWLSTHPYPEDRIDRISEEIDRLGGVPPGARTDSADFQAIRKYVMTLPKPADATGSQQPATAPAAPPQPSQPPPAPSVKLRDFENRLLSLRHPDNWGVHAGDPTTMLAPENGIVGGPQGDALAYGMMISVYSPRAWNERPPALPQATQELITDLQRSNANLKIAIAGTEAVVGDERGLSILLTNDSPLGGVEVNWLVTVLRPQGLVFFVGVAPERAYDGYRQAFSSVINSVRFK